MSTKMVINVLLTYSLFSKLHALKPDILTSEITSMGSDDLGDRTMRLFVKRCFLKHAEAFVATGALSAKLIEDFHEDLFASVVMMGDQRSNVEDPFTISLNDYSLYEDQHHYRYRWKLRGFLIGATSISDLRKILDFLVATRWWNSDGYFVIALNSMIPDTCSQAYKLLSVVWKYDLLSCVFLCRKENYDFNMYSYNPFSNFAPPPWIPSSNLAPSSGHPWTLLRWGPYSGDRPSCETIFFDKTRKLNGFPIRMSAIHVPPFVIRSDENNPMTFLSGEEGEAMLTILRALDATLVDDESPANQILGWVDGNGTFHGNLLRLSTGKVDIAINGMTLTPTWKLTPLYPHGTSKICFGTMERGTVPWLFGLLRVWRPPVVALAFILFVIAAITLSLSDRRRYISGFLRATQMCFSSSIARLPTSPRARMILMFILMVPLIFNSTIQGRILSLIKYPSRYSNTDSWEDLEKFDTVEGERALKELIPNSKVSESYVEKNLTECIADLVADGRSVSCLSFCTTLQLEQRREPHLYIAKDRGRSYYTRFLARPNWPLAQRFDLYVVRLFETSILQRYRRSTLEYILGTDNLAEVESSEKASVIRLGPISVLFYVLIGGWLCSVFIFIGEHVWYRKHDRIESSARQLRNCPLLVLKRFKNSPT